MGANLTVTCDCCGSDAENELFCASCSHSDDVSSDAVADLAAAIRRGDIEEAEYLLDRIARDIPGWEDRVSLGRYSPRAR